MRADHQPCLQCMTGLIEKRLRSCVDLSEGPKKNYDLNECESFFTSATTKKFHCELKNGNFFGTLSVGIDGYPWLPISTLRVPVTAETACADWGVSRGTRNL